jgi:hypothetical protein
MVVKQESLPVSDRHAKTELPTVTI